MNKKLKILHMGDSNLLSTGYSNQSRYILEYLSNKPNKYEIHHQAWHYHGLPIKNATFEDGERINYWIHPGGQHSWGKDMIPNYINKFKPDIFFTLCDSFMLAQDGPSGPVNYWFNQINTSPAKTVFYFPSDGDPFPLGCEHVLKKFDYVVAMAKFGQEQVKKLYNIDALYIPHVVDTNKFYKLSNKDFLKKKWSNQIYNCNGQHVNLVGKRVILCVARNQGRKMLSHLPKIFAELKKDKKYADVVLLFKSDPNDVASGGVKMIDLCKSLGVGDSICWTKSTWISGYTVSEMREIYNIGDIFVLPTSGEGFGVPFIEAMSCELPLVATDFTTPRELVDGDENQLAKLANTLTGTYNVERGIVSNDSMLLKVKNFLDNPELILSTGIKNRLKVLKEYDMVKVMPKWAELFDRIAWE